MRIYIVGMYIYIDERIFNEAVENELKMCSLYGKYFTFT